MSDDPETTVDPEYAYTKLTTKVKRGTGTRDQDTVKVVTRHPDPVTAAQNHDLGVEAARRQADKAREIQPDGETDD